jgi:hypothetical protein
MVFLSTPYGLRRMMLGVKAFVDHPISLDTARAVIETGMRTREAAFLESAAWNNPRAPTSSCSTPPDASRATWSVWWSRKASKARWYACCACGSGGDPACGGGAWRAGGGGGRGGGARGERR